MWNFNGHLKCIIIIILKGRKGTQSKESVTCKSKINWLQSISVRWKGVLFIQWKVSTESKLDWTCPELKFMECFIDQWQLFHFYLFLVTCWKMFILNLILSLSKLLFLRMDSLLSFLLLNKAQNSIYR